jgi:hypothetical protein
MNSRKWAVLVGCLLALGLTLKAGCRRSSTPTKEKPAKTNDPEQARETALENARDALRGNVTFTSCKNALQTLNTHFQAHPSQRSLLERKKEEEQAYRKFLVEKMLLKTDKGDNEVEEVLDTRFRPLDAFYLESCFQLRDAVRSLDLPGHPRAEQARLCLEWVARHVTLLELKEELLPPFFVLQRGYGTAEERALVFLEMLRQANLDGCLVGYPDPTGGSKVHYWAVGVLGVKTGDEVFLFDPRLGIPIPGPAAPEIATFAQVQKQPEIVKQLADLVKQPTPVTPEQVKKSQLYLACPLSALAPRLKYLESELALNDRARLALDAEVLWQKLAKIAPVGAANNGTERSTPLRALRAFLPAELGGVAKAPHMQQLETQLIPWVAVERRLREMQLDKDSLPPSPGTPGEWIHIRVVYPLFNLFVLQPRTFLVHGQLEKAMKRLQRIQEELLHQPEATAELLREAPPDIRQLAKEIQKQRDKEKQGQTSLDEIVLALLIVGLPNREIVGWREKAIDVHARAARALELPPDARQKQVEMFWGEDQYFWQMLRSPDEVLEDMTPEELQAKKKERPRKKLLSTIAFRAAGNALARDSAYLLALAWQDRAEHLEANLQRLQRGKKEEQTGLETQLATEARRAWKNAVIWWGTYVEVDPSAPEKIKRRLEKEGLPGLEELVRDLRTAFSARLLQARAHEGVGGTADKKKAVNLLESICQEDNPLTRQAQLIETDLKERQGKLSKEESTYWTNLADRLKAVVKSSGLGDFTWLRAQAQYRLQQLKKGV